MYRQNIQFPAKDAPLREDVHALGALVGEIVLEQCGEACFDQVEGDRVAAIRRREGDEGGEAALLARTPAGAPWRARLAEELTKLDGMIAQARQEGAIP